MQVTSKKDVHQLISRIDSHQKNRPAIPKGTAQGQTPVHQDSVLLSKKAKEVMAASRLARSVADIRTDKTADLKQRMDQGTYRIDGNKIASKMIQESVLNHFLLNRVAT